jgi:hypothetical protein
MSLRTMSIALNSLAQAAGYAASNGWTDGMAFSAVYVSAGKDTHPITLTHPQVLERQIGREVEYPRILRLCG